MKLIIVTTAWKVIPILPISITIGNILIITIGMQINVFEINALATYKNKDTYYFNKYKIHLIIFKIIIP